MSGRLPDQQFSQLVKDVRKLEAQFATHQHQQPNELWQPDGGCCGFFFVEAAEEEVGEATFLDTWTVAQADPTDAPGFGFTIEGDGRITTPVASVWQVNLQGYGYTDPDPFGSAGYIVVTVNAQNAAGTTLTSHDVQWGHIRGGAVAWFDQTVTVRLPAGGHIQVVVADDNQGGSPLFSGWEMTGTGWALPGGV